MSLTLQKFGGIDRSIHPSKLPDGKAETAENVDVTVLGVLRPRLGLAYVGENPTGSGNLISLTSLDPLYDDPIMVMQTSDGTVEILETFAPAWSEDEG